MRQQTTNKRARRREWLLEECEKLRQECNRLTQQQRRRSHQHALELIYGTDATAAARRR